MPRTTIDRCCWRLCQLWQKTNHIIECQISQRGRVPGKEIGATQQVLKPTKPCCDLAAMIADIRFQAAQINLVISKRLAGVDQGWRNGISAQTHTVTNHLPE